MRKAAATAGKIAIGLLVAGATAWSAMAVYLSNLPGEALRIALAGLIPLATLAAFLFLPRRGRTLCVFLVIFALAVGWWTTIPPSNTRDWPPEAAVLAYATVEGDRVTIHNIRNFSYRSETDFDARYYDKTFDLRRLDSVDLLTVYWMGDTIAHVMLSFGFEGTDYVTFSIEARKARHEDYSSIKGFFRRYELIYVVGDERDLIRVRTEYRSPREDVYLFHTRVSRKNVRLLFMEFINAINRLRQRPEFYNSLTENCTTNIVRHIRAFGGTVGYNWKVLLSGYASQYAYDLGLLDSSLPFDELKQRSYINPRVHAIGNDPDFSRRIREGLPVPPPIN